MVGALEVDAFEQEQELGVVERSSRGALGFLPGEVKTATFEAFDEEPVAVGGEVEDAGPIAPPRQEEEEVSVEGVVSEATTHERREPVDTLASVDRLRRGEDPNGVGEGQHDAASRMAARMVSRSARSTGPSQQTTTPVGKLI